MGFSPASTHGGGSSFNGGTITTPLAVNPSDPAAPIMLAVQAPAGAENNGDDLMRLVSDIAASLRVDTDAVVRADNSSGLGAARFKASDTVGNLTLSSPSDASPLNLFVPAGTSVFRVLAAGAIVTAQHAAPADGDLAAGECALWFDQTNGAGNTKLMVKAKSADGTVKTATILLA